MTTPVEAVAAVEALLVHARKISPSPYMSVYVSDLERALGREATFAHKVGANEGAKRGSFCADCHGVNHDPALCDPSLLLGPI